MNAQTLKTSATLCNFSIAFAPTAPLAEPFEASTYDYGFDFNPDEFAAELSASSAGQLNSDKDTDEICALSFLS